MKRFACLLVLAVLALGACTEGSIASQPDGGPSDAAAPPHECKAEAVSGIAIGANSSTGENPLDPLGYPPYALDGCTLVYVAPPAAGESHGELRARDLTDGLELVLAPATQSPSRPTAANGVFAWEAIENGKSQVRVVAKGAFSTLHGTFDHAGEPRTSDGVVVFTAWKTGDEAGDTDVLLYDPASQAMTTIASGPGQQRFADVNASLVAVTDFSEDPKGAFSPSELRLADVVIFDRATGARTLRAIPGKQAFPLLSANGQLAYLDWGSVHPEPKLSLFTLKVGLPLGDVTKDANVKREGEVRTSAYVRPSLRGSVVEWIDEGALFRRPLDLSQEPQTVARGTGLLAPVAAQTMSVVVEADSRGEHVLRAIQR